MPEIYAESAEMLNSLAKKPYAPPRLIHYGDVRTLTGAGGGPGTETKNPGGNCPNAAQNGAFKTCSDRRAKCDLIRIGRHPLGFGIYLFHYKPELRARFGTAQQFGVVADEVEAVLPEAVEMHGDGFKRVDYAMLGVVPVLH